MKKQIILLNLVLSLMLSSCGTLVNHKKPKEIKGDEIALKKAEEEGVVENKYAYFVGDALLVPVALTGVVGMCVDIVNNDTYRIKDQELYDAWLVKYKKETEAKNKELLNQAKNKT